MLAVAIIALVLSLANLAWNAYVYFHPGRVDIRVAVRTEPIPIGEESLELVVVATNHGTTTETIETIGLKFRDESNQEYPDLGVVSSSVDKRLPPNDNVRFKWDLGDHGLAVGRRYTGFVRLATGAVIEAKEEEFGAYGLHIAGLTNAVRPAVTPADVEADRDRRRNG
jgi:hypothetical protein